MSTPKRTAVRIRQAHIRTAPGFPGGMPPIDDLDASVVLITGANGSGKSTTARTLQECFFPDRKRATDLTCSFTLGDEPWQFSKWAGQTTWLHKGESKDPDFLASPEMLHRYMLSMHDLLVDEDRDLAQSMYKASIGGYNLDKAVNILGYGRPGKATRISEYQDYEKLAQRLKEARSHHSAVMEQEKSLEALRLQREKGREAGRKREYWNLISKLNDQKQKLDQVSAELAVYPSVLSAFQTGDEERYETIMLRVEELSAKITSSSSRLDGLREQIAQLKSDDPERLEADVNVLEQLSQDADRREQELLRMQSDLSSLMAERDNLRRQVGSFTGAVHIEELEDTYQSYQSGREDCRYLAEKRAVLEKDLSRYDGVPDAGLLQEGIVALSAWLRSSAPEVKTASPVWYWLLAGVSVAAAVSGWFGGVWGLLIAVLAFVLAYVAVRKTHRSPVTDPADYLRQEYLRTGLQEPSTWTPPDVAEVLSALQQELKKAASAGQLKEELDRTRSRLAASEAAAQQALDRLHILAGEAGIPDTQIERPDALYLLLQKTADMARAESRLRAHQDAIAKVEGAQAETVSALNTLLEYYGFQQGYQGVEDYRARVRMLRQAISRHQQARLEHKTEDRAHDNLTEERSRYVEDAGRILNRLGLSSEEVPLLHEFAVQKPAFDALVTSREVIMAEVTRLRDELTHYDYDVAFEELSPYEISEYIRECEQLLEKQNDVMERIWEIERDVAEIKANHNLEDLLTQTEGARQALQLHYHQKARSVIGHALATELRQELASSSVPEVMKVSQRLFSGITKGAYALELQQSDEGGFKALDTRLNQYRTLDQLSSGTRIQLLLSVRLAFIEVHEDRVAYPLFADELLANSDDERAGAVIETLMEVAATGRQVFYLTAQSDELNRWQQLFPAARKEEFRLITLGSAPAPRFRDVPGVTVPALSRMLPDETLPLKDYLAGLALPEFNPVADPPHQLHLGYLSTETAVLHQLLLHHIDFWHQFDALQQSGGLTRIVDASTSKALTLRFRAVEHACTLLRQGRDTLVGHEELRDSGAVSDAFMDPVLGLLESVGNQPSRLIEALRSKEHRILRFSENKIEPLERYFRDNEYISDEPTLTVDEFRQHMRLWLTENELTTNAFDEIFHRITPSHILS